VVATPLSGDDDDFTTPLLVQRIGDVSSRVLAKLSLCVRLLILDFLALMTRLVICDEPTINLINCLEEEEKNLATQLTVLEII